MKNSRPHNLALYLPLVALAGFLVWWVGINQWDWPDRDNFTDSYSLVALTGGIAGLFVAKKWGLFKSKFGRGLGFLSIGLILQFFGHFIYALYFRLGDVELAYPSVGDVPFLLTGVFYAIALYFILKIIIFKGTVFKPRWVLLVSILVTAGLAWLMYVSFLDVALQDERGTIYSIVNAAYPIIQTFYFIMGLVAIMQARRMSGGKLFFAVSVVIVALLAQYAADFSFLYQSYHGEWEAAGTNDLFYLLGYGFMTYAILAVDRGRRKVLSESQPAETGG